jgi:hypothetical protein
MFVETDVAHMTFDPDGVVPSLHRVFSTNI